MGVVEQKERTFLLEVVNPADPKDVRGPTYNWKFPDGHQVTILERKKGEKFGGHYHGGNDPSKNPERIFVAKGEMKVRLVDPHEQETELLLKQGSVLTIYPFVSHWLEALTDVVLIESRVTHFDPEHSDTFPA